MASFQSCRRLDSFLPYRVERPGSIFKQAKTGWELPLIWVTIHGNRSSQMSMGKPSFSA